MKVDIYQEVTNSIIELIEKNRTAKRSLWTNKDLSGMFPVNFKTKQPYSGINILLLWARAEDMGFGSSYWLTFKQAQELGGTVKKGEKGTRCAYYGTYIKAGEGAQESKNAISEGEDPKASPFIKSFFLFNADQIEGLELPATVEKIPEEFMGNALAESILQHSGAAILEGQSSRGGAYYVPSKDEIYLPSRESFITPSHFYSVALHELTHWTGHSSRLARDFSGRFGTQSYAFEELVAELGAAFLTSEIGAVNHTLPDHAGYIENWLKVLRNDKKAIFTAASQASKAHRFILDYLPKETTVTKAA